MNNPGIRRIFTVIACLAMISPLSAQLDLRTRYLRIHIDPKGFISSLKNSQTNEEYSPSGHPSPLLALWAGETHFSPLSAKWEPARAELTLSYANGAMAVVKVRQSPGYLRLELSSLSNRGDIDNIVWGPLNTKISGIIGDIIGVVRDGKFAIGMLALNDITITGEPCPGDMAGMYYYVHSSDPKKYPVAPPYKEGQTFHIGGDGVNDVAFYSHPEEYFHMKGGNGAELQPAFGSSLCMHARDRRKTYTYLFTLIPGFTHVNEARHQVTDTLNADFIGSAVALYGGPDSQGSKLIENIILAEGLPHPTIDGKWIKDPDAFRPDIAWYGPHDSTISYARKLNVKGIQDEGLGEYYVNPADRWAGKRINFTGGGQQSIREFTELADRYGMLYGLHTLCEFVQPHSSDVHPIPYRHLQTVLKTRLVSDITATDSLIVVADTSFLREHGTWHDNADNTLRIDDELLTYNTVTTTRPYTLQGVRRGLYKTEATIHPEGAELAKLQMNCYQGFVPDIKGELDYADFYAKLLVDGGMNYIDFDGMESCMYQNQGYYSFKTFFGRLYDTYHKLGGKYLRIMGSTVTEGSWHYQSVCNVGGGDHMFSPILNKWGIEGKDMRDMLENSYFPGTFGIINLEPDWSLYDAENLQAKSIGWKATYMLGLSQDAVEHCGEKEAIFAAFRAWEDARENGAFSESQKRLLKDLRFKFHLEEKGDGSFRLSPVRETRVVLSASADSLHSFAIENPYPSQPLEFSARLLGKAGSKIQGLTLKLGGAPVIRLYDTLTAGEFLLAKNGKLFLADRNRKIRKELTRESTGKNTANFRLPAGKTPMNWNLEAPSDSSLKVEIVVSVIGPAQNVEHVPKSSPKP